MIRQDEFERIIAALNEAMIDDACWPEVSALVDHVCGTRGNILILSNDLPDGDAETYFAKYCQYGEDRSEWVEEYFPIYHPADEHVPRVRKLPDSQIVPRASLFTDRELKTSLAYNEGLPRYDMRDGLTVRMEGPRGARIVLGLGDPVDAADWSTSQVAILARLLPHVRQYVRVRSALARSGGPGSVGD